MYQLGMTMIFFSLMYRVWGYIGCMVFTPFSGWLIDTMSHDKQTPDYR